MKECTKYRPSPERRFETDWLPSEFGQLSRVLHGPARSLCRPRDIPSAPQRGAEPVLGHRVDVVRSAVDEGDRDPIAPAVAQLRIVVHELLGPADPQLSAYLCDNQLGVVAQVTSRPADEHHPGIVSRPVRVDAGVAPRTAQPRRQCVLEWAQENTDRRCMSSE